MKNFILRSALPLLILSAGIGASFDSDENASEDNGPRVHYLEIVTPELDATCATYARIHGLEFGEPVPEFGGARTAELANGAIIGVRAPMRATEDPVVRPYFLVEDIEAVVKEATEAGGEIAVPPMEIPGHGKFAIFLQGGIDHGLWQL